MILRGYFFYLYSLFPLIINSFLCTTKIFYFETIHFCLIYHYVPNMFHRSNAFFMIDLKKKPTSKLDSRSHLF
jgi:hypothetical protein